MNNRVAIITGGAGKIGSKIVEKFLNKEYNVLIVDRSSKNINSLNELLLKKKFEYNSFLFLNANLSSYDNAKKTLDTAILNFDKVDVLVNLAGNATGNSIIDISEETLKKNIENNLYSTFFCTKIFIEYLLNQNKRGTIVNISSVNSIVGIGEDAYSLAKSGVNSLTRTTAVKFGKKGIRCNCICLGTIKALTPSWKRRIEKDKHVFEKIERKIPLEKMGTPDDVAEIVYFLSTDKSRLINGSIIVADGGWTVSNGAVSEKDKNWWEI